MLENFLVLSPSKNTQRLTIYSALWGTTKNVFAASLSNKRGKPAPGLLSYGWQLGGDLIAELFGKKTGRATLPTGFPKKLFDTVNNILAARGGVADRESGTPNYWVAANGCSENLAMWVLRVDYAPTADPGKLRTMEEALEDRLTRAGYDVNVRILNRPLRLEIDKPKTPTISLADHWQAIGQLPTNERRCAVGVTFGSGLALKVVELRNDAFSSLVAGAPGSGKTQLALGLILSMCYANSPEKISLLICDPKALDWMPLNSLPHLAAPIATEPQHCAELIQSMVNEMDERTRRAARGDTSFLQHAVALYVDELADLLVSLPNNQSAQVVTNLQRIAQKGRGVGLILICATQRVFELPAPSYSKLNLRIVGRTANAGDSAAATGVSGTLTNKLPGRGAFELYPAGERIQAFFVADPDKSGYAATLQGFVGDIRQRWPQGPHWTPTGRTHPAGSTRTVYVDSSDDSDAAQPIECPFDDAFMQAIRDAYAENDSLSARRVRDIYQQLYGKGTSHAIAKRAIAYAFGYGDVFDATDD